MHHCRLANLRKHCQHSEFGAFCPVFRTHGCRSCSDEECQQEPDVAPCVAHPHEPLQGSCAANEVWSYGSATQVHLEKYVRVRKQLKPYIAELAANVSKSGVPTMRPLWYEFPDDDHCRGVNDQYLLGPSLLVAPVTVQNATSRSVYFPRGADWQDFFDASATPVKGGQTQTVDAPLDHIPVYWRKPPSSTVALAESDQESVQARDGAPTPAPASATTPLITLTDPKAKCMDGTQAGIYVRPATSPSAKSKWIFTLQGGGECVTEKRCSQNALGHLGSSKFFAPNYTFWGDSTRHFIDASCEGNPTLCEYNFVYMPYCSQDLWYGQRTAVSPETFGLYFSGRHIITATLDMLAATHDLKGATEVILSGNSAGGFGVYNNVDYMQSYLPQARVVGAPIAGYEFYAWPYTGPGHTSSSLADFRAEAMAGGAYNKLWDAVTPGDCLAKHASDPGACLLPCFSYTSVKAPLYIVEAQSDSVVLMGHDWLPYNHNSAPARAYMQCAPRPALHNLHRQPS